MSMGHLGNTLDIHCGGRDLIFPHHENEIAQSEGATGEKYVRYWMHNGFINIDEEKMSKSLGNVFNVNDVIQRYEALVLRFFLATGTHYRNPINFSDAMLDEAACRVAYFYETLRKAHEFLGMPHGHHDGAVPHQDFIDSLEARFREAMDDDFHVVRAMDPIGEAFKILNELASTRKQKKMPAAAAAATRLMAVIEKIDQVLNFFGEDPDTYLLRHRDRAADRHGISADWVEAQISARVAARTARDWDAADRIRAELDSAGVILMDRDHGTDWMVGDIRETDGANG